MALTLMIENLNNDSTVYSSVRSESIPTPSYYKFYQSKLRQLITQTRYRKEQEARIARQKQSKNNSINDVRLAEQRLHREYMNHIRERSKVLPNKIDEHRKSPDSIVSNTARTVTLSVVSTSMESRPKYTIKTRQTPVPPKQQQQQPRIISAPTSSQRNVVNKSKIIPTIKIDSVEETLSKANIHSFTQITSSSQNSNNKTYKHARQSIMNTIMLHLNSNIPSNTSNLPTYEDIDNKFSSSISPTVYQDFERIAV